MKEEEKEKYSAFITEVSEILGIGKPGDIIKLCIITDNFFKPYQKRIAELERENELIKSFLYCTERSCNNCGKVNCENFQRQRVDCCGSWVSFKDYISNLETESAELKARLNAINLLTPELEKASKLRKQQLTKAKELLNEFMRISKASDEDFEHDYSELIGEAEQFLSEVEK